MNYNQQNFDPVVHQELSNIKNLGHQILQKQTIKRSGHGNLQNSKKDDEAYENQLRQVWQSMKMNSGLKGTQVSMVGITPTNTTGSMPNADANVVSPNPTYRLKSTQVASKKMIARTNYPSMNGVQRNVSGHGRKRVNYYGTQSGQQTNRITSRDMPKVQHGAADGYQSYREVQNVKNRLTSSNQNQLFISISGQTQAHQSFEAITSGQAQQSVRSTVK